MTDLTVTLAAMLRPRLLITAARMAALSHDAQRRATRRPIAALLAEEDCLNRARLSDGLGYSASRHVAVMSALLCAARNQAARH